MLAGGAQTVRAAGNPIQEENARQGSWDWQRAQGSPAPTDSIDGYLGAASAAPGATVTVHASTSPAATFRVEVFRLGWYNGVGGRLMTCAPSCSTSVQGAPQTMPTPEPTTGLIRAQWPSATSFTIGSDWVSGYYVVNFVLTSGPNSGKATWAPLIVTAPAERSKEILVHATATNWQAYNNWGGKSLYDYNSTGGRAGKVSFDRPYKTSANTGMYDWEIPMVRWLEREGYDVSYASDIDTHRNPSMLQAYKLVLVNAHDEYWSTPIRDAFDNAKAAGTNLAFFGANIGYWHIRFEDGERTMVGYKDASRDPNTNPAAETVELPRPAATPPGVHADRRPVHGGLLLEPHLHDRQRVADRPLDGRHRVHGRRDAARRRRLRVGHDRRRVQRRHVEDHLLRLAGRPGRGAARGTCDAAHRDVGSDRVQHGDDGLGPAPGPVVVEPRHPDGGVHAQRAGCAPADVDQPAADGGADRARERGDRLRRRRRCLPTPATTPV